MTERTRTFRQTMAWFHGWAGLVLGWLLFAMCAAGTAAVFRGEIGSWMRPEVAARADPLDATAAALGWLSRNAATAPAWYLTAPDERSTAATALFQASPPGAPFRYRTLAFDPVTGRPDGIRETLGGEFLYRLHFELQLPYPWGRIIASAAAMLLLVTLVSGIITHRRIFADFFTVRPGKDKRSWLDAHNALGVFALPFHLMISFTGILTLVTLTLPWAGVALYGDQTARMFAELNPNYTTQPATGVKAPPADVRAMLADAVRRFDGGGMGLVSVEHPGDAGAVLRVERSNADRIAKGPATVTYAMATGRLIAFYAEARPAKRSFDVLYGLHLGRFMPLVGHWLYFLCGLALTATVATGLVLWSRSRPAGAAFGHHLVQRTTVGIVVGMPLAVAAFFWANRLLPLGLAGRPDAEVRAFFVTLALALVAALFLKPRPAWIGGMGLVAAAWALLPLLSAVTTARGLPASLARGDWLFAGFDLTALALGALAAAIALVYARRRPPAPRRRRA